MVHPAVIPCLRYHDAPAAIAWLEQVFGFTSHLVVPGENNTIAHAQLSFGNGMLMLGSVDNGSAYGQLMGHPQDPGAKCTQSVYLVVPDADAVYARVQQARAEILMDIRDEDYGGRGFSCRDLEGHIWSIGTYDPSA
jgi:uncharacterized glyoxalase superfamily protein PhnB